MSISEIQDAKEAIRPALEEAFANALTVCRLRADAIGVAPGNWRNDDHGPDTELSPLLIAIQIGVLLNYSPQQVLDMLEPQS